MVKTPRTRHSKPQRQPVTIELEAGEVSRLAAEAKRDEAAAAGVAADTAAADETPVPATESAATAEPASKASSAYDFPDDNGSKPAAAQRPDAPASPPPPADHRPSRLPVFAAALVGGVVALAGAAALQFAGLLGPTGAGPSLDGVNGEIAALKSEVTALKGNDASVQVDALSQGLDQLKGEVASLRQTVESGAGDPAASAALDERISQIETSIRQIDASIAALPQEGGATAEMAALGERIAGVETLAKAAADSRSAIEGRIGAVEQGLATLQARVDAQAAQPKIALSIAAAALKSAIERGVPFQSEVETFAAIAPDVPEIAALRPYAEAGVPTRADIIAGADAAAKAIMAAASPPDPNAGFLDRLLSSAESLVSVRPIGDVAGQGVSETVARMEVAVRAGDFAKALAEYETLPEVAKAAGEPFAAKLKARLDVERLADQAIAAAMKAA